MPNKDEIERAIAILSKGREQFSYRAINAFDDALNLAITALQAMSDGCEWCNGQWQIDVHYRRENGGVFSSAKRCPNCGRKLPQPPEGT